jgi:hypothetical protein
LRLSFLLGLGILACLFPQAAAQQIVGDPRAARSN